MPANSTKATLQRGGWVSGPIIEEIRSIGPVAMLAQAGHDFLWFDLEHNMTDWETLLTIVQFSHASGITPLVRVTDLSYAAVARALDAGAHGIIIPRVETKEQVEQTVQYAKYPPLGRRGAGGLARNAYAPKSVQQAIEDGNAETMVVVQIESPEGVANVEAMASVDGVDVICIGPQDLSINMGMPGQFDNPEFIETIRNVASVAEANGKACGMVSRDAASFATWFEVGCRFLVCNSDLSLINQAATRDREKLVEVTGS
jgi:4-hydroxy-2-oxoheptanedioate aldolase